MVSRKCLPWKRILTEGLENRKGYPNSLALVETVRESRKLTNRLTLRPSKRPLGRIPMSSRYGQPAALRTVPPSAWIGMPLS